MNKIGIFGVPRSGTSWLAHIFSSHPDVALRFQPLFSYGHKGVLTEISSKKDILCFFEDILNSHDPFTLMTSESQKNYPVFKKASEPSHIVFKETQYLNTIKNMLEKTNEVRIIGIVRNPLAVLASWAKAPKEFSPEWNLLDEWRRAPSKNRNKPELYYGFDQWKRATELFIELENTFPNNFLLVNYKSLNHFTIDNVSKIFDFCNLKMCDEVYKFINESKSKHDSDPYSVYRSKANDNNWKNILPNSIVDEVLIELKDTELETFIK